MAHLGHGSRRSVDRTRQHLRQDQGARACADGARACVPAPQFSVLRYESVIHEFDPYFNYRSTIKLVNEGAYEFWNWFDHESWHPLGRVVGGTVYPGLMFTAAAMYKVRGLGPAEGAAAYAHTRMYVSTSRQPPGRQRLQETCVCVCVCVCVMLADLSVADSVGQIARHLCLHSTCLCRQHSECTHNRLNTSICHTHT